MTCVACTRVVMVARYCLDCTTNPTKLKNKGASHATTNRNQCLWRRRFETQPPACRNAHEKLVRELARVVTNSWGTTLAFVAASIVGFAGHSSPNDTATAAAASGRNHGCPWFTETHLATKFANTCSNQSHVIGTHVSVAAMRVISQSTQSAAVASQSGRIIDVTRFRDKWVIHLCGCRGHIPRSFL